MRSERDNLLDLQRRFVGALREPIYGKSRALSFLPPRPGDVSYEFTAVAEDFISSSVTMEPVERLELYHRQYWYRLLDSLSEDFPGLRLLLGDKAFWRLVEAYLESVPSRSFNLLHLGSHLADFVAENPDSAAMPVHAEDMARLEYALCESFESAEFKPLPPEHLAESHVSLQPHVKLLALRTKADVIWRRAMHGRRKGGVEPPSNRNSRFVVVFRKDYQLRVERISKAAYAILRAIAGTNSLDSAMDEVSSQRGLLGPRDASKVADWFTSWNLLGWFWNSAPESCEARRKRRGS